MVNGVPAISYFDSTNGDLKYIRAFGSSGTNWAIPITIDSTGNVGSYTSLAFVNGFPAISYLDSTNGNLKYVRAGKPDGSLWDSPRCASGLHRARA